MSDMSDESFLINTIDTKRISHGSVGGLEKKRLSWLHPQDMEALMVDARIGDGDNIVSDREEIGDEEHKRNFEW